MNKFTNIEYADMHLMYGRANCNANEAKRLYAEWFPTRIIPNNKTFQDIDRRLRETGQFATRSKAGRPVTVDNTVEVLQKVEEDPTTSCRKISKEAGFNHMRAWRVLKEQLLHPFHILKVQALNPNDYPLRLQFCRWLLQCYAENNNFIKNILFTDESTFAQDGIINSHNMHVWADENPFKTVNRSHQVRFSLNIWCGVIGDYLIGPYVLPHRLDGATYLDFLQNTLPDLMDDIPLLIRHSMWFMHDGAPAHYSRQVRNYLNQKHDGHWIGRGGPVAWPARSPDLNPLDFFIWGHLKSLVYETEVPNLAELQRKVEYYCNNIRNKVGLVIRVRRSLIRRAETCIEVNGRNFEQLL